MLRITTVKTDQPAGRELLLEGRLLAPWVPALKSAVSEAGPAPIRLNLAGLRFIDADGLAYLHTLKARGVSLKNCSPFVSDLLNTPSGDKASPS